MNVAPTGPLTSADLLPAVQQADPSALLVPLRVLRRVIRQDRRIGGLRVPHRRLYLIDREKLLAIASPAELGLPPGAEPPPEPLLLPYPDDAELARTPRGVVLQWYSRLLFHGAVHRALAALRLDEAAARERLARIGEIEVAEARDVLRQEGKLLADDDVTLYEELAAVYLELRAFDPEQLPVWFPACHDRERIEAVFLADVDADALRDRARLAGAGSAAHPDAPDAPGYGDDAAEEPTEQLTTQAADAAKRGNLVRAAILQQRAMRRSTVTQVGRLRGANRDHLERLTTRLLSALSLGERDRADWLACLAALLEPAARGYWNVESRLLYDLQSVCLDVERPVYAADLVTWIVSLGGRPIKRPLPDLPLVLAVRHVRKARRRLASARIGDADRKRLGELLDAAEAHLGARMREVLRPKLHTALDEVGLVPAGHAERLSRDRMVEELLDRIVATGALTMGDLRDAIARNRVKLPDLRGPLELLGGDPLLRANERLADSLDGIYRRGEVYLRWMQALSSLFFGTRTGRMVTLYLLLPLLASFFTIKGVEALVGEVGHVAHWVADLARDTSEVGEGGDLIDHHHEKAKAAPIVNPYLLGGLAVFYLLLFHLPRFRTAVGQGLYWGAWRPLRAAVWDVPVAIYNFGPLQALLASLPFRLFMRLVGRPLLLTVPLVLALYLLASLGWLRLPPRWTIGIAGGWFLLLAVLLNTRAGLVLEERFGEAVGRGWQLFHENFLAGILPFIVWLFRWLLDQVEQVIYAVDERLRFREGESAFSFVAKLVFGLFWFAITYLVRLVLILFVEPQVNPIKHFPVVTVSHKLTLLAADPIARATGFSFGSVVGVLGVIPGVFGFLAWELKENWRLYRANASPTIDPEIVGSHGEHVINFIRPGFHSGTLPRLFAKLRRSAGKARHRAEEGLHHAEHELRDFVQRELAVPLTASAAWGGREVSPGEIALATNRIRVELRCDALGSPAWLELENRDGRLLAGLSTAGWVGGLEPEAQSALANVLLSFYHRAGVELVREESGPLPGPLLWEEWAAWCDRDQAGRGAETPLSGARRWENRGQVFDPGERGA